MLQLSSIPSQNIAESYFLNDIFLNAFMNWPDRIALECEDVQWRYSDLYTKVIHYLTIITAEIGENNAPGCIAIYGNKTPESIAAILAILLSGHAYMPLDISWPSHRIETVLDTAKPKLLLQTQLSPYLLKQLENIQTTIPIINLLMTDVSESTSINNSRHNAIKQIHPEQIAYLLFTSGTTGIPKGVCVSHRAASAAIEMLFEHVSLSQDDKIANQSALCYDLAMFDLYSAFKVGASVYLMPAHIAKIPKEFIKCINENNLTSLFMVNSAIEYILKYTNDLNYTLTLKNLLLTGDPLTENLVALFRQKLRSDICIWNLYSAVEMPYAFAQRIALDDNNINFRLFSQHGSKINFYLQNDSDLTHLEGALHVKSPVLFSGYLTNDTGIEYIQNHPITDYRTGDWVKLTHQGINLFGRVDRQVKIMGNRVELDDIEVNLESIPLVIEAAVYFDKEKNKLIAFLTIEGEVDNTNKIHLIKQSCQKLLPPIMHPNEFVIIDTMPRTTSGKKDRKILIARL